MFPWHRSLPRSSCLISATNTPRLRWSLGFLLVLLGCGLAMGKQGWFNQANQLYDQGKYMEAVKYYRAAIQDGEYEPYAWFNMGNTLVQLNKHHLAVVAYRRSIELAPKFVRPWMLLGDLYFIHGDVGLAVAAYRRAARLGENSEHLHYALAECYRRAHDLTMAEREYETVIRINPDRVDCWFALAELREQVQDYSEAVRILRTAIRQSVTAGADLYFYLAYLQLQQDSISQGMAALEDGLLLNPGNQMARRHLAMLYSQQGSPWMSIFTLEQGLRKTRNDRDLEVDLGQVFFDQKRYPEALDHYISAWKFGSVQGRIGAENVGNAWYNQGDTVRAEVAYRRVRARQ